MNQTSAPAPQPAIAFLRGGTGVDDLVAAFALSLIERGWRVRGLIQAPRQSDDCCGIALVDLDGGARYPIFQELGSGSASCRVDPTAVAEATVVMRRIAAAGADLAIFNRFAALEAAGSGFAAEMLDIMERGIPVLTTVPAKHADAWRTFTGGLATELEAKPEALEDWFLTTRAAHGQD